MLSTISLAPVSLGISSIKCPLIFEIGNVLNVKLTTIEIDINASKNILAAGLAVSVCGATVRPDQIKSVKAGAMKQKPKS